MASILKVDDLRGNTAAGNITITSEGGAATMQLQQGVAKAWGQLSATGTISLNDSFNNSAATDVGTGIFEFNFTNSMNNDDFCIQANGSSQIQITSSTNLSTSTCRVLNRDQSNSAEDTTILSNSVKGDLA